LRKQRQLTSFLSYPAAENVTNKVLTFCNCWHNILFNCKQPNLLRHEHSHCARTT